jgi:hypothetical protein
LEARERYDYHSEVIDLSRNNEINEDTLNYSGTYSNLYYIHYSEYTMRLISFMKANKRSNFIDANLGLRIFDGIKIKLNLRKPNLHDTPTRWKIFFEELDRIEEVELKLFRGANIQHGSMHEDELWLPRRLRNHIIKAIIYKLFRIFESVDGKYVDKGEQSNNSIDGETYSDMYKAFESFLDGAYIGFKKRKQYLPKTEILDLLDELLNCIPHYSTIENTTVFDVSFDKANIILSKYQSMLLSLKDVFSYDISPFLEFSPNSNLSSGELAMYRLFSSMYSVEYRLQNDLFKKDSSTFLGPKTSSLLILLDEADSSFHPLWKKKYIGLLTSILPKIFRGREIQLIYTTHDPLSLSDLPSHNVIYLNRLNGGLNIVSNRPSFAANITDLLSDSFFIDDGLLGDFALAKIDETIGWLKNNVKSRKRSELFSSELSYYKHIIATIDEPILKIKLAEMMDDVKNSEYVNEMIDSEIDRLKKMKK